MKITALTAMMMAAAPAVYAHLGAPEAKQKAAVCMDAVSSEMEFGMAKMKAAGIFARIGVKLEWREGSRCPSGALKVSVSTSTPSALRPGALAYAMPYEGTHIVVFWDRIKSTVESKKRGTLLSYVLAHEITHVLEGVSRHSASGILKAHWDADDYSQMAGAGLDFAPEDIEMIHTGLARRESLAAGSPAGEYHGETEKAEVLR